MESSRSKSCCIICYKKYCKDSDNPNHHDKVVTNEEKSLLKKFWKMFGRYLEQRNVGNGDNSLIEESINNGTLGTCQECFKIMEDFCNLFKDMEMIELLLNWKVLTLKNIMYCAERVPSRVSNLAEIASETEVSVKFISDMKTRLIENCNQKLFNSFPKLQLKKCDQPLQNDKGKTSRLQHDNDELEVIFLDSPNTQRPRSDFELPASAATNQNGENKTGLTTSSPSRKELKCRFCKKQFTSIIIFRRHQKQCQINKSGNQSSSISVLSPLPFLCDICNKSFGSKQALTEHKQITHEGLLFKCGYCPKTRTQSGALVQHITQSHRDESGAPRPFKMNIISKNSNVEVSQITNMNSEGNEEEHCTASPNGQLGKNNLEITKTFTRKIPSLIGNIQQRPFACNICKKTYRHYNSLKIHKDTVHEGLKYKCGYCPAMKTQPGQLKIHIRQSHKDSNGKASLPYKMKIIRNNGNTVGSPDGSADSGENSQRKVVVITLVKDPGHKDLTKVAVSPDTSATQRSSVTPVDYQENETGIISNNHDDQNPNETNESNSLDDDYNNHQKMIKQQMECETEEVKVFVAPSERELLEEYEDKNLELLNG